MRRNVVVLLLVFVADVLSNSPRRTHGSVPKQEGKTNRQRSRRPMEEIDPENIRENLRHLTEIPHLGGTPADLSQARELVDAWLAQGLDRAKLEPYNVLLSYPETDDPGQIFLYDGDGETVYASQKFEEILRPEQNHSDVVPPFNAYSTRGDPRGELVYVNYGRLEDFTELRDELGIDPTGKICISRYGRIFRGNKGKHAEEFGCLGLILYTDPADYAVDGESSVYPDSWYLPGTGVQRGTVKPSEGLGDPLTPGYPAIESAYRLEEEEADLPALPIHPIGYDDARAFLEQMAGPVAPESWQGELDITYRLGPAFAVPNWEIHMHVTTHNENQTTYNAIGFIEGAEEPDRYVILGNHRDAWVFGSLDPSSGTAVMMEVSRVLGEMLQQGWRPRRSIMFLSWGSEEHGLLGSREWVEHFGSILGHRAVAYVNIDIAVQGNFTFRGRALPLIHDLLYEVTKRVSNPDSDEVAAGRPTVFDTWLFRNPVRDEDGNPTDKPVY